MGKRKTKRKFDRNQHPKKKRKKIEYCILSDDEEITKKEEIETQQPTIPERKNQPFAIVYNDEIDVNNSHNFLMLLATLRFSFLSKNIAINYSEIINFLQYNITQMKKNLTVLLIHVESTNPESIYYLFFPSPLENVKSFSPSLLQHYKLANIDDKSEYSSRLKEVLEKYKGLLKIPNQSTLNSNNSPAKSKRRSARISASNEIILIYPPEGPKRISLTKNDLMLLLPDNLLNDSIIEFYLEYIRLKIPEEKRDRFYFYSPFFYSKICSTENYSNIFNWTSGVNIFEKKFLIIPINELYHWKLAIVCLNLTENDIQMRSDSQILNFILFFDSMSTNSDISASYIKQYLIKLWKNQHNGKKNKSLSSIPHFPIKVPQQSNFSDCGVYLLHYVEKFCAFDKINLKKCNSKWFNSKTIRDKRETILGIIATLIKEYKQREELKNDQNQSNIKIVPTRE